MDLEEVLEDFSHGMSWFAMSNNQGVRSKKVYQTILNSQDIVLFAIFQIY